MNRHYHIHPKGFPIQKQGYRFARTAREHGRTRYGARRYRLVECHDPGCPVWPPLTESRPGP